MDLPIKEGSAVTSSSAEKSSVHGLTSSLSGTVELSIALIEVKDGFGNSQLVRTLLGSAFQASIITALRIAAYSVHIIFVFLGLGNSLLNAKYLYNNTSCKARFAHNCGCSCLSKICSILRNKRLDTSIFSNLSKL